MDGVPAAIAIVDGDGVVVEGNAPLERHLPGGGRSRRRASRGGR